MNSLTCTIEPDEFLGLSALVELDRAAAGGEHRHRRGEHARRR